MKHAKLLVLAVIFLPLIFGAAQPELPTHAGTIEDPFLIYNTPTVRFQFDDYYAESTIVALVVELQTSNGVAVDVIVITDETQFVRIGGKVTFSIRSIVEGYQNGDYRFRLKVIDESLNESTYSEWYYARKDWRELQAPSGGGCTLLQ